VAILETPAGFQPNSAEVAGQIGRYMQKHLQNHDPAISIIPARKRGTPHSPDDPAMLEPLYGADFLFVGPGSPTYAARQLRDSIAWQTLQACHRLGAALIFASATTIASSRFALPVYEIYKVGEDLHWQAGLDFFAPFGLNLVFVPHWNNNDGGNELDTSHCYIGRRRYEEMLELLPSTDAATRTIVGIDENTALIVDFAAGICRVRGNGGVTLVKNGEETRFERDDSFDAHALGAFGLPVDHANIRESIWQIAQERRQASRQTTPEVVAPETVLELVAARDAARQRKDWAKADSLRDEIEASGWHLLDTPDGPQLKPNGISD
jgi:hypothetical protein